MAASRDEILQTLGQRIQEIESRCRPRGRPEISLGIPSLQRLLPGGLPAGSLVELLSAAEGTGAGTLALLMAWHACGEHKALVLADCGRGFYPPAAAKLGLALERLIVVRPAAGRDLLAALDQALRCPALGAVVGWCDRLLGAEARRLQLAAEAGGGLGLLLRPARAARSPSFAAVRLLVAPEKAVDRIRRVRVEVVRCRGGPPGRALVLEIDDETGHVRLPAEVAPSPAGTRSSRASG